jgi:hypothetical protein
LLGCRKPPAQADDAYRAKGATAQKKHHKAAQHKGQSAVGLKHTQKP